MAVGPHVSTTWPPFTVPRADWEPLGRPRQLRAPEHAGDLGVNRPHLFPRARHHFDGTLKRGRFDLIGNSSETGDDCGH